MSTSKLRNTTAADDKVLGLSAVDKALRTNLSDIEHVPLDKRLEVATTNYPITADNVRMYLRGISENSGDEIDALISDLRGLRERLMTDGNRIEQEIAEYATLNQSVLKLAEVISDGVAHVKTPQPR